MKWLAPILVFCLCLTAVSFPHHALGVDYDVTKPLNLTGRVTKIEWENPHIHFYIDVVDEETRKTTNWVLEMRAPSEIEKYGWTKETMKIGDVVNVDLLRTRSGCACDSTKKIIIPATGKKLGPLFG